MSGTVVEELAQVTVKDIDLATTTQDECWGGWRRCWEKYFTLIVSQG
jgi:hypothetical protein